MWEICPEAVQTICELLAFAVALGDSIVFSQIVGPVGVGNLSTRVKSMM